MEVGKYKSVVVDPAMTLLLNRSSLEFFGILTYGMPVHLVEESPVPAPAYTNGEWIHIVTSFPQTPKSFCTLLVHELWHVINYHAQRGEGRDRMVWNLAIDSCTNHIIQQYVDKGLLEWPKFDGNEAHVYFKEIHDKTPEILPEELYDQLMKNAKRFTVMSVENMSGSGQPQEGDNGDSGNNPSDGESPGEGQDGKGSGSGDVTVITVKDEKTGKIHKITIANETPEEKEKSQKIAKGMNQKANLIWNSNSVSKGEMPGNLSQVLDKLFHVEIPWDEVLERSITYHAQTPQRMTWASRNIYMPHLTLPGKLNGEDVATAVFVVDSSGSVGDKDLAKFMSVCCDSTQYYKAINVLVHDHTLQQEHRFVDRPDRQSVFDKIKKVMGRGGTSHKEVFDRLEEMFEEENISVVVFLTDYESDIESIYRKYRWIQEIPTVFVLNSAHKVALDAFEVKVIRIN